MIYSKKFVLVPAETYSNSSSSSFSSPKVSPPKPSDAIAREYGKLLLAHSNDNYQNNMEQDIEHRYKLRKMMEIANPKLNHSLSTKKDEIELEKLKLERLRLENQIKGMRGRRGSVVYPLGKRVKAKKQKGERKRSFSPYDYDDNELYSEQDEFFDANEPRSAPSTSGVWDVLNSAKTKFNNWMNSPSQQTIDKWLPTTKVLTQNSTTSKKRSSIKTKKKNQPTPITFTPAPDFKRSPIRTRSKTKSRFLMDSDDLPEITRWQQN